MAFVIGTLFIVVGLGVLLMSWRCSQDQPLQWFFGSATANPHSTVERVEVIRSSAGPLGITGGATALGGLAVVVSGWDVIGSMAAIASLIVLAAGLFATWHRARD